MCNIRLILLFYKFGATECRLTERCELHSKTVINLSTLFGERSGCGRQGYFFGNAEAINLKFTIQFKIVSSVGAHLLLPLLK